ncbi:MAG: hypothetical protein HY372_04170 [Candidatus Andersenbacteria bacterium]|nr:hypothetical protein [Candidatus Andersenbacteria bacterium]
MDKFLFLFCAIFTVSLLGTLALPAEATDVTAFENPLGTGVGLRTIIQNIIAFLIGLAAFVSLAAIVYGGFRLILGAVSSDQEVARAKQIIYWAVIGLVVIGMGAAILEVVQFIL